MKKKKILWKLLSFIVPITLCMGLTSCGGGDDPEPLKVNPMDISLLAEKGSSSTFTINTDNEWKANCLENWLHLSSTSGNGNATITITAQSSNDSENPRKAVINIMVGDKTTSVNVTQEPLYINATVDADIDNMVVLTKSICVKVIGSGDVAYYRGGYQKQSQSAGWTDEKVLSNLSIDSKLENNEDLLSLSGLTPNTNYYLYTVAFDEKGNQGPLKRYEFKTAAALSNRPKIAYGSVTIENGEWRWSTQMNPYTSKYYMYNTDDIELYSVFTSNEVADALKAYVVKELIDNGELSPIVQNGNWKMKRNSNNFYCLSWAFGSDNNYAGEIDQIAGVVRSNARTTNKSGATNIARIRKLIKQGNVSLVK